MIITNTNKLNEFEKKVVKYYDEYFKKIKKDNKIEIWHDFGTGLIGSCNCGNKIFYYNVSKYVNFKCSKCQNFVNKDDLLEMIWFSDILYQLTGDFEPCKEKEEVNSDLQQLIEQFSVQK